MAEHDGGDRTGGDEVTVAANGKPFESVWHYPRPPRLERVPWRIRVAFADELIVDAPEALRVLETSQPPAYYVHPGHVRLHLLQASTRVTYCEWKGEASYVDVVVGSARAAGAGWRYDTPNPRYADLAGHYAFYPQRLDGCWVDDELVDANDGSFYGGWITANVRGPFKGGPGTSHW